MSVCHFYLTCGKGTMLRALTILDWIWSRNSPAPPAALGSNEPEAQRARAEDTADTAAEDDEGHDNGVVHKRRGIRLKQDLS